jgi:hypothetical protein
MRLRLKASYDISSFPPQSKVILSALKQFGMIMADNGSSMYVSGDPDNRWSNDDLGSLKQVPASAFEVVLMDPIYTSSNLPQGKAPTITSFTATPPISHAGQPVVLNWTVNNAIYFVVSPDVGAIRGNTATVYPTVTTTYTLYATNQYHRSKKKVTVTIQ